MRANFGLAIAILPLATIGQVITVTEYASVCSAIYTTGSSTVTIVQSTVTVEPQPLTDDSINAGEGFVIEILPPAVNQNGRRQSQEPMYVDSTGTSTTDPSQAVRYRILNGTLQSVAGGYVSCNLTDDNGPFSISTTPAAITAKFFSKDLAINWDNETFENGSARFYTTPVGEKMQRLFASFRGAIPTDGTAVTLAIKSTGSLSVESSSKVASSTRTSTMLSTGSMTVTSGVVLSSSSTPMPPGYSEAATSYYLTISGSVTRTSTSVRAPNSSPPAYSNSASSVASVSSALKSSPSMRSSSLSAVSSSAAVSSVASSLSSARSSVVSSAVSRASSSSSTKSSIVSSITSTSSPSRSSSSSSSRSSTSTTSYPQATGGVSPNGFCGAAANSTFCPSGRCCSQYGACGTAAEYCGAGCQPRFGYCNPVVSAPPSYSATATQSISTRSSSSSSSSSSTRTTSYPLATGGPTLNGYCGADAAGTFCETPFGRCCSQYGACGNDAEYCGAGCQTNFGSCSPMESAPPLYSATAPQTILTRSSSSLSTRTTLYPSATGGPTLSGYCGANAAGTFCEAPFGNCCSQYGACGNDPEYCGVGCQPQFGYCSPVQVSPPSYSATAPQTMSTASSSSSAASTTIRSSTTSPPTSSSSSSPASSATRSAILSSPTPCSFGSDPPGYGQDDQYCTVNLTQPIRVYDTSSTSVFPSTNGLLLIGEGNKANEPLRMPDERVARNDGIMSSFFAPFWDDLGVEGGTPQTDGSYGPTSNGIWYEITNTGVTFEYDLDRPGEPGNNFHFTVAYTFATPGVAVYRYYSVGNAADNGASAAVGMQGIDADGGQRGITYSYSSPVITPGLTVTCDSNLDTCVRS